MYKLRKRQKLLALILLFVILFSPFMQLVGLAHNAAFLSSTIDTVNKKYTIDIMEDKVGFGKEDSHLESKLGDFTNEDANLITDLKDPLSPWKSGNLSNHNEQKEMEMPEGNKTGNDSPWNPDTPTKYKIFTFPTVQESTGALVFGSKNNATSEDIDRAFNVGSQLSSNLNGLLTFVNGGRGYSSVDQLILTSLLIRPTSGNKATIPGRNGSKYVITYHMPSEKAWVNEDGSVRGYAEKIEKGGSEGDEENESMTFVYAIPKGYVPTGDNKKPAITVDNGMYEFAKKALEEPGSYDTPWLTIHHLTAQANHANTLGITFQTGRPDVAENAVTSIVTQWALNLLYGLMNWLGLQNVDDLIYNRGVRSSSKYSNGLMSSEWWKQVSRYYMISLYIAIGILVGAIVKILIQEMYSTVNPALRMYIYKIFQRLAVVAVLLIGIVPLSLFMITINNAIVDLFATQVDLSNSGRILTHGGLMSGIIIEFFFFAITFYVNFVYIMRKFVIALLIATAPLFIVSMAFSYDTRGLFDIFIKELIANIFLQAFHAISFAFIFNLQASSAGIESIVAVALLVPLTELFRELIFGKSGSGTIKTGKSAGMAAEGIGKGVAAGVGAGAMSMATSGLATAGALTEAGSLMDAKDMMGSQAGGYSTGGKLGTQRKMDLGDILEAQGKERTEEGFSKMDRKNLPRFDYAASKTGASDKGKKKYGKSDVALGFAGRTIGSTIKSAQGMSDLASGAVFGNSRQMKEGASNIARGVGMAGNAVGETVGMAAGTTFNNFKDHHEEVAVQAGKGLDIRDINPLSKVESQDNGTSNLTFDGKKLYDKGFSNIGTYKIDKDKMGLSMEFDAAKGSFAKTNEMGKDRKIVTNEGEDFAKLVSLNGSEQGQKILKEELGIDSINHLGQGKYKVDFNEKFFENNGISGIQKNSATGDIVVNQDNNRLASAGTDNISFIPKASTEQVQRGYVPMNNPTQKRPDEIIDTSGPNHTSTLFSRSNPENKWDNFNIEDYDLRGRKDWDAINKEKEGVDRVIKEWNEKHGTEE